MDMYAGGQRSGNIKLGFWRRGWSSLCFSTSEVSTFSSSLDYQPPPRQIKYWFPHTQSPYPVFFGLPPILTYSSVQVAIHLLQAFSSYSISDASRSDIATLKHICTTKMIFLSPHFSINQPSLKAGSISSAHSETRNSSNRSTYPMNTSQN